MKKFERLQELGKALILPICIMPIGAMFYRLGSDIFHIKILEVAGKTILDHLSELFAITVGMGLSKDKSGIAGFSAYACQIIIVEIVQNVDKNLNMGVFSGIISGILAAYLYNRYNQKKLPEAFAYFSGKRYVPIITILWALPLGALFSIVWPGIQDMIDYLGKTASHSSMGPFFFGFFNRLLIPLGLHHGINSIFFYQVGSFTTTTGEIVTGDYMRFLAGDPTAGVFLSGFYPIMMFGIPGALFAIYLSAKKENKKEISGLLLTMGFISFLTGITEPFEFSFMFLSPLLYFIHAFLVGLSLMVTNYFGVLFGFSFSGGFIDFVLNFSKATNGFLIIPIGLCFSFIYFLIFYNLIQVFNLKTLGREDFPQFQFYKKEKKLQNNKANDYEELAKGLILAFGGKRNIINIDACRTRLKLNLKDKTNINIHDLRELGSKGIIKTADNTLQIIFGPDSKNISKEINEQLRQ